MAAIGRDPDEVTISIHCEFRLEQDTTAGGRWSEVGDGYGDRSMLGGGADRIVDVLGAYREAGLQHVLLVPVAASPEEWDEHVQAADEIRRHLT